jgi:hypothetical protein
MTCEWVKLPNGAAAIVCHRGKKVYCYCGSPGLLLCDWKLKGMSVTCDEPMCREHALEVSPGKHLCTYHQKSWADWKAKRSKAPA